MTTALALHNDLPPVSELLHLGSELHKTGLLPAHIKSGGQAMAIILAGRELGLSPMTALRSIHLVEGRVTLAADLQLALVKRAGVRHRWLQTDTEAAVVELTRAPDAAFAFSYSIADAKRAGLAEKQNWRRHTAAMLRARAISGAIRAYCPDLLTTVYDPDEIGEATEAPAVVDVEPPRPVVAAPPVVEAEIETPAPAPAVVEPPAVVHDPSFADDRAWFCGELRKLGLKYEEVAAWTASLGRPRPSGMTREQRGKLLDHLLGRGAQAVRDWTAERAAIAAEGGA